nr:TraB/GumN family protein [Burkholderiales bacterium]
SYLYGTIHVGKLAWAFPGPNLVAALRATEVLALELDITDPVIRKALLTPQKGTRALALSAKLRERLARQAVLACVPAEALTSLSPLMQAATYVLLSARWDGLDGSFGQDAVLAAVVRGRRPIVSLETPEQQLTVLSPADPQLAKKMLEQMLDQLEQGSARATMVRLADAWASGDLAALEDYPSWCDCADTEEDRAFMREANDNRNPNIAAQIDLLHGKGKPFLAAVGALHMTGDKALTKLLAQRGFRVERVNAR